MASPSNHTPPPINAPPDSDDESFSEFERLESTLPDPLKRSATSLLELLSVSTNNPHINPNQPYPLGHHASPSGSSTPAHPTLHSHLVQKLSESNSGREHSPIPLPKPKFDAAIHKPAMNTKQSSTGVLWVTERAGEYGFNPEDNHDWANLGQGAPEHGDTVPGSFKRPTSIPISELSKEYAPTAGIKPLREAVANLYNEAYRKNKSSKYTYKNVCIVPGGRAGLTRIASIISDCYLSFFLPDYTAYAEMLSLFKNFSPIPVPLSESDNYEVHLNVIKQELVRGVSALLTSNPRNPTGKCMTPSQLKRLHQLCRQSCLLIMDEFYSHYYYDDGCTGSSISSAEFVEDVNKDPVLILNGLTKAFRLPGWRVCWILGPEEYINALSSAGSFLDGGCNGAFQYAAVDFLQPLKVRQEMKALQIHFKMKRDYILGRLSKMGFTFNQDNTPNSTFYLWLNLSHLPGKLSNCLGFFHECLHEKVIIVPGFFFLINPQNLSRLEDVIWYNYVRISYGPELPQLEKGMDGIERILHKFGCLPYEI
ncbi:PLP-dependent transferase [Suhomyces tanzawaensis NRRL Y-17324]|uniref:PLP-dependent transferase n=1 Tax=Suhomyces tanzawaensis NRRL Y-17324 TaxID=984487 RepID=A0A1E4SL57_9ASCO|nr:PLP-dependent transferase [Suhomyces tanzawaensis NRRL Y-17324]ODV80255.1 PLP-dependent transferase [Suhomyces tanzawaensis NRRL Y-17324]